MHVIKVSMISDRVNELRQQPNSKTAEKEQKNEK